MMINSRLAILVLSPLLLLGATCVTKVEQKGPKGPWVGEVTNTGSDPEVDVRVEGWWVDSDGGDRRGMFRAETCPFDLLPGQKGYFITDPIEFSGDPTAFLPLKLTSVDTFSCQSRPLTTGLAFRVIDKSREHNSALVEMRNDSQNTYFDVNVCGLLLNRSGEVQEMAKSSPFPAASFKPGGKVVFPITFSTPIDGPMQFAAKSVFETRQNVFLDSWHFDLSASRVVRTEQGRELQVVGEIRNDSTVDLDSARYEFYLKSSPTVRASGSVGSYAYLGTLAEESRSWGTGLIPAGQKAPVVFSLPLDEDDSTHVEFAGVTAHVASVRASRIPATDVTSRRVESDVVHVKATLTNPFNAPMEFFYCFELRGARGQLVGASCEFSCGEMADPWTASRRVRELAPTESVEVVAYGWPGTCPIVPPSDPAPRCP
jgi:hypothetical protein